MLQTLSLTVEKELWLEVGAVAERFSQDDQDGMGKQLLALTRQHLAALRTSRKMELDAVCARLSQDPGNIEALKLLDALQRRLEDLQNAAAVLAALTA